MLQITITMWERILSCDASAAINHLTLQFSSCAEFSFFKFKYLRGYCFDFTAWIFAPSCIVGGKYFSAKKFKQRSPMQFWWTSKWGKLCLIFMHRIFFFYQWWLRPKPELKQSQHSVDALKKNDANNILDQRKKKSLLIHHLKLKDFFSSVHKCDILNWWDNIGGNFCFS